MRRTLLGVFAMVVGGFGLATVLALGTASVSAMAYRASTPADQSIAPKVQANGPNIARAAGLGFAVGASVMAWMFFAPRRRSRVPEEDGSEPRSEV